MTLVVERINCYYGRAHVLKDVSISVSPGEVLCLLGRNGAGKTTTLRAVMGIVRPKSGSIKLDGVELTKIPAHQIPKLGIAYVPQGRGLFPSFTVEENLRMGLFIRDSNERAFKRVLDLFPVLRERLKQKARTLSGGEQQMLSIARALCTEPKLLMLDEPTEGLMPTLVVKLFEIIKDLKSLNIGILLVEQRIDAAFKLADRVAVMENGSIVYESTSDELASNPEILFKHLGVKRHK